jgi:hypothetical protein
MNDDFSKPPLGVDTPTDPSRIPPPPPPAPSGTSLPYASGTSAPALPASFVSPRPLAFTLQVIFGTWIVLTMLGMFAVVRVRSTFTTFLDGTGDFADVSSADDMLAAYNLLNILLTLVTIGVFLAWFYRCYSNLRALGQLSTERDKKSAIWWWFVPFATWVIPYQMAQETWTSSREPGKRGSNSGLIMVWWGLFQVSLTIMRWVRSWAQSAVNSADNNEIRDAVLQANTADIIAIGFAGLAAISAWAVVRAITDRQERTHEVRLTAGTIGSPS